MWFSRKWHTIGWSSVLLASFLLSGLSQHQAQAQVSEAGVLFLLIPPGARHNGMGQTGVTTANDANAMYYNPGALAFVGSAEDRHDFQFMHVNWLPELASDIFYDYGAFTWYIDDLGTVGLNFTYFNLGEQTITDELANELGTITSFDMSIGGTYSTQLTKDFGIGGSLKFIYSRLSNKASTAESAKGTGSSVAIDLGIMKKNFFFKNLTFGTSLSNIGPSITYVDDKQSDPLPTNWRIGLSYIPFQNEFNEVIIAYDLSRQIVKGNKSESADPLYKAVFTTWGDNGWSRLIHNIGAEYTYSSFLSFRTGTYLDPGGNLYDLNFGAGLKYSIFRVDFAYTLNLGSEFNPRADSRFFSFGLRF